MHVRGRSRSKEFLLSDERALLVRDEINLEAMAGLYLAGILIKNGVRI